MRDKPADLKSTTYRALLLSESQRNALGTLCIEGNKLIEAHTFKHTPEWVKWLDQLRIDAENLVDLVSAERAKLVSNGESPKTIDKRVAHLKSEFKPTMTTMRKIKNAIGEYRVPSIVTFDEKSGRLNRQFDFPKGATVDELRHLMFGAAIGTGEWKLLRRCRNPNCEIFFCDTPGRRPMRDCRAGHGKGYR